MKYKKIVTLSKSDREKKLAEAQRELIKLNGQVATGTTPKSPGKINQLKKDIARILTFENTLSNSKSSLNQKPISSTKVDVEEK